MLTIPLKELDSTNRALDDRIQEKQAAAVRDQEVQLGLRQLYPEDPLLGFMQSPVHKTIEQVTAQIETQRVAQAVERSTLPGPVRLSPDEELQFQGEMKQTPWFSQFAQANGEAPNLDDPQYDYRSAWKKGVQPEPYGPDGGTMHWPSLAPDGTPLKSKDHPTAWMEPFMQATGQDPASLGLKTREEGEAWLANAYGVKGQPTPQQVETGQAPLDGNVLPTFDGQADPAKAVVGGVDIFGPMGRVIEGPFAQSRAKAENLGIGAMTTTEFAMKNAMESWDEVAEILAKATGRTQEEIQGLFVKGADTWATQYAQGGIKFSDFMGHVALQISEQGAPGVLAGLDNATKARIISLAQESEQALTGQAQSQKEFLRERLAQLGVTEDGEYAYGELDESLGDPLAGGGPRTVDPQSLVPGVRDMGPAELANTGGLVRQFYRTLPALKSNMGLMIKATSGAVKDFLVTLFETKHGPGAITNAAEAMGAAGEAYGQDMINRAKPYMETQAISEQLTKPGTLEHVGSIVTDLAPFFAASAAGAAVGQPQLGMVFGVAMFGAPAREALIEQGVDSRTASLGGLASGVLQTLAFRYLHEAGNMITRTFNPLHGQTLFQQLGARGVSGLVNAVGMVAAAPIDAVVQAVTRGEDPRPALDKAWEETKAGVQERWGADFLAGMLLGNPRDIRSTKEFGSLARAQKAGGEKSMTLRALMQGVVDGTTTKESLDLATQIRAVYPEMDESVATSIINMLVTPEMAAMSEGKTREQFMAEEGVDPNAKDAFVTGRMTVETVADRTIAMIDLFAGHDPSTVMEESIHMITDAMPKAEKAAMLRWYEAERAKGETRSENEFIAQETAKYLLDHNLLEQPGGTLLDRFMGDVGKTVSDMLGKVNTIPDSKAPKDAREFFERVAGRGGEKIDIKGNLEQYAAQARIQPPAPEDASVSGLKNASGVPADTQAVPVQDASSILDHQSQALNAPQASHAVRILEFQDASEKHGGLPVGEALGVVSRAFGSGLETRILYPMSRDFSGPHDAQSLATQVEIFQKVPPKERQVFSFGMGGNKLEDQPLYQLSVGCNRNAATMSAIMAGAAPKEALADMISCHGSCYKDNDQGAQSGGSPFTLMLGKSRRELKGDGPGQSVAYTTKFMSELIGREVTAADLDKPKTESGGKGTDSQAVLDAKAAWNALPLEEKQARWKTILKDDMHKGWSPQEMMTVRVADPDAVARTITRMKDDAFMGFMEHKGSSFIRGNQQGDWFNELAIEKNGVTAWEAFAEASLSKWEKITGKDRSEFKKKFSVVTTGWYTDIPVERVARIMEKYGDHLIVQVTGPMDFEPWEAKLRMQGISKLMEAGRLAGEKTGKPAFRPVVRLITDEFGQGGARLNDRASIEATLKFIIDNQIPPDQVLETPLHFDAPGLQTGTSKADAVAIQKRLAKGMTMAEARQEVLGGKIRNLSDKVATLFDVSPEETERLAWRVLDRNDTFFAEDKSKSEDSPYRAYGHRLVGLTYERLTELGIPRDLQDQLRSMGYSYSEVAPGLTYSRGGQQLEGVFPARCCTTGKCNTCGPKCMAKMQRTAEGLGIGEITDSMSYEMADKGPGEAGALLDASYQVKTLAPPMYSSMARTIEAKMPNAMPAADLRSVLEGNKWPGIKGEELRWSGVIDHLDSLEPGSKVSKKDVLEVIQKNQVEILERRIGGAGEMPWDDVVRLARLGNRRDDGEQLTEAEYADLADLEARNKAIEDAGEVSYVETTAPGQMERYREVLFTLPGNKFKSQHWGGEEGILGAVRVSDRKTPEGKTLMVEEVQSDMHQEGRRKGYGGQKATERDVAQLMGDVFGNAGREEVDRLGWDVLADVINDPATAGDLVNDAGWQQADAYRFAQAAKQRNLGGVPDAPYKTSWPEFLLKRVIRMAAEEGYDRVSIPHGDLVPEIEGWMRSPQDARKDSSTAAIMARYDTELPRFLKKYLSQWGSELRQDEISQGNAGRDWVLKRPDGSEVDRYPSKMIGGQHLAESNRLGFSEKFTLEYDPEPGKPVLTFPVTEQMKQDVLYKGQASFQVKRLPGLGVEAEGLTEGKVSILETKSKDITRRFIEGDLPEALGDRAVNFNIVKWQKPEDILATINQLGGEMKYVTEEMRRGVRTDEEVLDAAREHLANNLGLAVESMVQRRIGEAWNVEQINAAGLLVTDSADQILTLARKINGGEDSSANVLELQQRVQMHMALQAQLQGAAAEAGRALRAFSMLQTAVAGPMGGAMKELGSYDTAAINRMLDTVGGAQKGRVLAQTLTQLAQANGGKVEPYRVQAVLESANKRSLWDWAMSIRINGMLSGIPTHVRNMTGNSLVMAMSIPERWVAGQIGKVSRYTTDVWFPGNDMVLREGLELKYDRASKGYAIKDEQGNILGVATAKDRDEAMKLLQRDQNMAGIWNTAATHVDPGEAMALMRTYGSLRAIKDSLKMARAALISGESSFGANKLDWQAQPQQANTFGEKFLEGLWTAVNLNGRVMGAEDEGFKSINYMGELHAQALRQASMVEKLNGPALANRVQDLLNHPTDGMLSAAMDAAQNRTFSDPLTGHMAGLGMFMAHPFMRLVQPFVKTPWNVFKYAAERTFPFGAFLMADDIRAGGSRRDMAISKMVMGSALYSVGLSLAYGGLITGGGPSDKTEREGWLLSNKPYSIRLVGQGKEGSDLWISYQGSGEPITTFLQTAADFAHVFSRQEWQEAMDPSEVAAGLILAVSKNMTSKTFLAGFADLVHVLDEPDKYGETWIGKLAGSFIPASVGNAARASDPEVRVVGGFLEGLMNRIPGLKDQLPARRNIFGETMQSSHGGVLQYISPINWWNRDEPDAIAREITENHMGVPNPGKTITVKGVAVPLEPEEYSRLKEIAGQEIRMPWKGVKLTLREFLNKMVESPEYQQLRDRDVELGQARIHDVITRYYGAAREQLSREYPRILQLAQDERLARRR